MATRSSYRRRLPHYETEGRSYLLTFCTVDRWILPPAARDITMKHILVEHRRTAMLHTFIVMPDHVHIVLTPLINSRGELNGIADILHGIKGVSGRKINQALDRSGPVWQHESHDHQIRNDESLRAKCEYVAQNPVRAGLVDSPDEYPWLWREWIDDVLPSVETLVEIEKKPPA
jgi:putative transposase